VLALCLCFALLMLQSCHLKRVLGVVFCGGAGGVEEKGCP
jgi:hypothetical protein